MLSHPAVEAPQAQQAVSNAMPRLQRQPHRAARRLAMMIQTTTARLLNGVHRGQPALLRLQTGLSALLVTVSLTQPSRNPYLTHNTERAEKRQNLPYCDDVSDGSGFTALRGGPPANTTKMLIAHGVLASLAFVIFFPAGAIAIRLASFPGVVWFHAVFQAFAYLVYIAAFGLGVYLANGMNLVSFSPHTLQIHMTQLT